MEMLAEADARIGDDFRARNAGRLAGLDPAFEEIENVEHDVGILRIVVHRFRIALGMHEHHRQAAFGRNGKASGSCVSAETSFRMSAPASAAASMTFDFRVSTEMRQSALARKPSMTGITRRSSSSSVNRIGAGPRAFPADVENVGTFFDQPQSVIDRGTRACKEPAVRKAVGRDVDDPHDAGTIERET